MIPVLAEAGLRAVAIDLVGSGRSDKPTRREDYTYQAHVDWTWAAIEAHRPHRHHAGVPGLGCQDWCALIGLRLVGGHPNRFPRVVPTSPDDPAAPANRAAWEVLREFDKPFLCAFSDSDPMTKGAAAAQVHSGRCGAA